MSYIQYPLKETAAIPIDVIFEQFISQSYGGEQAWTPVKGVFTRMSQLRGEFLFDQHNLSQTNDPVSLTKMVEKLTTYYKYLLFLQTKFRFEYFQQGSVNIPFQWSNSFYSKKSIATPSLILEKACILYNLAIIYYTEGNNLMVGTPEQRKISTQKFRFGLWCISQIKQLIVNMTPEVKLVLTDFSESNLDILYHTMLGNCYAVLFINLVDQEDKIKVQNIASLASEASHNYTIALSKANSLIQGGENLLPLEHLQKVKSFLFYNTIKFMAIAGQKMSKFHNEAHEDDISGNHIGWALAYIQNSINTIQKGLQNENAVKLMEKNEVNYLKELKATCDNEFAQLNQRNRQIYKQEVPEEKKLPRTHLMEQLIIQPIEPKEMQGGIPVDENAFANFMSEDSLQMVQEIRQFAQQRSAEVENVQKSVFEMKNQAYLENYVNFFVDLMSQKQQQQIPQKISDKINKYNSLGGTKQLKIFIQTLKDSNVQCGMLLNNLKEKISKEEHEDKVMRNDYGAKWTRSQSNVSNKEYLNELKSLEDNFKIAYNIEMENQQRWQQNQDTADLMEKSPSEQVKVFCSGSSEDQFKNQNFQQLVKLEQLDGQINNQMNQIKDMITNINQSIRNTNFQSEVSKCLSAKVTQDKILETVLRPISLQIQSLNDIIAQFSTLVSEVCNLAVELQTKRNQKGNSGNMEQQEKLSGGMTTLVELFDDCQQGMKFYQDLTCLILDLDKKVNDFIQAREIEKANLIQMIHNDQSKINMNQGGFNAQFVQHNAPPNYFYPPAPQPQQPQYGYPPQNQMYPPNPNPYQMPSAYGNPYQQPQPQQPQQQNQQNPFYNNGQFNQGQSVFIPKK